MNNRRFSGYFSVRIFLIFISFFSPSVFAQNADRIYLGHQVFENYLEITTSDGKIILTPFSQKIIETKFLTEEKPRLDPSYAVVQQTDHPQTHVVDSENILTYSTKAIQAVLTKNPFQIEYFYKGKSLVSENSGYFEGENKIGFMFNLTEGEALYGGGSRALSMNRRGNSLPLYNIPHYGYSAPTNTMYYSIPLVISSNKYMILWDNAAKGTFDLGDGNENILEMSSIGGRAAYYIIAGDDYYDLSDQYTSLTGKQPLPPRWTLGNFSSRFGYHSEKETRETIDKFKADEIPVDGIVLDIFWFGDTIKGHMGNFAWDKAHWPSAQKMMRDFREKGVQTILISEPFVLKTSKRWDEAVSADVLAKNPQGEPYVFDLYFGTSGLIDIFKPEARDWFWQFYKQHTLAGAGAWWGDLGEPEIHPKDMLHVNGTAEYVHNVYGHEWVHMLYDGYQKDFPQKRPFFLMRAGFAGSQRYGLIPWSGDVSRSWGGFQQQPEIALQMGMQGLAYAHSDLGGFVANEVEGKVQVDAELYVRWLQYGVFQPIYRPHGTEAIPPEPVFWDEKTKHLSKQAILLRYKLMPYNYTLAYENTLKGHPLMRPLFYEEPDNALLLDYSIAYLWGPDLLVSPVLHKGKKQQLIYLPEGPSWTDFYSGEKYDGGQEITVDLKENYIPVFARSGAFIAMLPEAPQTTKDYSTDHLSVHYYADQKITHSKRILYDDDGITHGSIKNNAYEILTFDFDKVPSGSLFTIRSNGGKFANRPDSRTIELHLHNLDSLPEKITLNGKTIKILGSEMKQEEAGEYARMIDGNTMIVVVKFTKKTLKIALQNTDK